MALYQRGDPARTSGRFECSRWLDLFDVGELQLLHRAISLAMFD